MENDLGTEGQEEPNSKAACYSKVRTKTEGVGHPDFAGTRPMHLKLTNLQMPLDSLGLEKWPVLPC